MRELLASAVRNGTGLDARLPIPAFGKTGTTQNFRDALFIGFAGDLVVGVWVGNDDNSPMNGVVGGGLPAQIWRKFMTQALPQLRGVGPAPARAAPSGLSDFQVQETPDLDAVISDLLPSGGEPAAPAEAPATEAAPAPPAPADRQGDAPVR